MFVFIFLVWLNAEQEAGAAGRGAGGGAGVLVAFWNARAFVGEPEPPVPWCPHSNR
jgi:hypothetical protein